jgi:hypothetical protein
MEAIAESCVERLAPCRIAPGAQVAAELSAYLDKGQLGLLGRELVLKRRVHGFGETDFLDRGNLAGERIGLWISDVKGHGEPGYTILFMRPDRYGPCAIPAPQALTFT